LEYFRTVCKEIKDELKVFEEINKNKRYEIPYINWSYILNYNPKDKDSPYYNRMQEWLYFMQSDEFLQWLDNKDLEKENIDSKTIRFSTKDTELILKINEQENIVILLLNGNELGSVNIRKDLYDFVLFNERYGGIDSYFLELGSKLSYKLETSIFQLGLSILKLSYYKYERGPWESKWLESLEKDLKILGKNKKIIDAFKILKENLDNYFNEFFTYSKEEEKKVE
jgi:hypothetical protein